MNGKWISILTIVTSVLLIGSAQAARIEWRGTNGTDFEDALNWAGSVPNDGDYGDFGVFTENAALANKTPNLTTDRSIQGIDFDNSVGWTLSGSQLLLRQIDSSGAGTNTITAPIKVWQGNVDWTIGAGNTLVVGSINQDGSGRRLTLKGAGTLHVGGRIGYSWGNNDLYVNDGTLRVDSNRVYSNSSAQTHLNGETAVLELLTTDIDTVRADFGSRIIDETGLGLQATQDGDYVRVSVVPEPATMGLLVLGGLALIRRKRN